jgi:succinylarginine dihydrolase
MTSPVQIKEIVLAMPQNSRDHAAVWRNLLDLDMDLDMGEHAEPA